MKTIGRVFLQDIKSLSKNLIIFVVVIGITILPALYAWFNIASNWDPYSATGELPFAVCSLDKGFEYKGLKINAGDKVIENLKANSQMGWRFVDEDEAKDGVESGKYYSSIIIPEDFSENLLSITTGKFKQAKFHYYVTEKKNAIAPKITEQGQSAIAEAIDSTYVSTLAQTIAATLNITSEELESDKINLADRLTSALDNAKADIDDAKESIDLLTATLDSINTLIKSNQDMLPQIQNTIAGAGVAVSDIKSTIQAAQTTTQQLTSTIESLISSSESQFSDVSSTLNDIFADVSGDANAVAEKLTKVKTVNERAIQINSDLIAVLERIQTTLGVDCGKAIARLNNANEKQQAIVDNIESICDNIKSTGKVPQNAKADLDSLISQAKSELDGVKSEYSSIKDSIDKAITSTFGSLDKISDFAQSVDLENGNLNSAFKAGTESVTNLKGVLAELKELLGKLQTKIDKTITRIGELKNDKTLESMLLPIIEDPQALGEFLSAPVDSDTERIYPIENYGSAMTPFYSSLALWVGGIVLVAVMNVDLMPRDRKKLGKANSTQLFFGRYIIFFIIGQVQALIIALGDLFFLKVQCDNPPLFILTCLISSFVYTLFIYSLTITFSVIGKALAVIILVIQIAGSGGTFPIEVLPGPFKVLSPYMPFKYGINALRETVAGVDVSAYLKDVGILLLFIIPALILGLLLRKPCIKIIKFFNEKIESSDLII